MEKISYSFILISIQIMVRDMRIRKFDYIWLLTILTMFVLSAFNASASSQTNAEPVKVLTFNILAPCWASPEYYPLKAFPYLERTYRREKISNLLSRNKDADIFALQEVTEEEFYYLQQALKNNYIGYHSLHSRDYWTNWSKNDRPWEPNGNAIFLKKTRFSDIKFKDITLSSDGNHAAYVEVIDNKTHQRMRAVSIHLDSDKSANRKKEFQALLQYLPPRDDVIDVIAGDFNTHPNSLAVKEAGFVNILNSLGVNKVTCPSYTSNFKNPNVGIIDHVLIRHGNPLSGQVIDFGLLEIYPNSKDRKNRVNASIQLSGSDHFPVEGAFVAKN